MSGKWRKNWPEKMAEYYAERQRYLKKEISAQDLFYIIKIKSQLVCL